MQSTVDTVESNFLQLVAVEKCAAVETFQKLRQRFGRVIELHHTGVGWDLVPRTFPFGSSSPVIELQLCSKCDGGLGQLQLTVDS